MFKMVGVTDERTSCDCCNKTNLKRTVVLQKDNGEYVFYGTTCAGMALGFNSFLSPAQIKTRIEKRYNDERIKVKNEIIKFIISLECWQVIRRFQTQLKMNPKVNRELANKRISECLQETKEKVNQQFADMIKYFSIQEKEVILL